MIPPTMQRRHYEYIAEILSRVAESQTKDDIVWMFVRRLKVTNPKFDADVFRQACRFK